MITIDSKHKKSENQLNFNSNTANKNHNLLRAITLIAIAQKKILYPPPPKPYSIFNIQITKLCAMRNHNGKNSLLTASPFTLHPFASLHTVSLHQTNDK